MNLKIHRIRASDTSLQHVSLCYDIWVGPTYAMVNALAKISLLLENNKISKIGESHVVAHSKGGKGFSSGVKPPNCLLDNSYWRFSNSCMLSNEHAT